MMLREHERLHLARALLAVPTTGTRRCWVCANLGHCHPFTGCRAMVCPCGRRSGPPVHPAPDHWGGS